jgi:hypothetical protein
MEARQAINEMKGDNPFIQKMVDFEIEVSGSEKQIKWAKDIINKLFSGYASLMCFWEDNYFGKESPSESFDIRGHHAIAIMAELKKNPEEMLQSIIDYYLNKIGYSAKSWIDNRHGLSMPILDLAKEIFMQKK